MSLINCIESTLKSNTEAALRVMLLNYGVSIQLHRIESGTFEVFTVATIADVNKSLNGKYFLMYSPMSAYYVWYDVDYTGTDPLISGKIAIKIDISKNDTNVTVAQKTLVELGQMQDFACSLTGHTLTVTNRITGNTTNSTAGNSGFTVVVTPGTNPDADSEYKEIYGKKAGPVEKAIYYTVTGIVTGDQLLPVDSYTAGTLKDGWLWTLDVVVKTGDTLYYPRQDSRRRRYIVLEPNILGTTNSVMVKWALSSIAD